MRNAVAVMQCTLTPVFGVRKKNFRDPQQATIKTLSHATSGILMRRETNSATIRAIILHCVAREVCALY